MSLQNWFIFSMMQYIFFSDLHTICNLFENMIFVNISWLFFFSPSVLYLSQSLLHSDLSMFYRLAHEVCHTWFGIVIGPLDWTEEWLTEGFCTYLEDIIHTRVLKVKKNQALCLHQYLLNTNFSGLNYEINK